MPNVHANTNKLVLEDIKGIGPAIQKAMVEGGVETPADLAGSTVAEIEAILEPAVAEQFRKPEIIDGMIQDAKKKIADWQENDAPTNLASVQNHPASNSGKRVNKPEWQKYEEFAVFFQYGHSEDGQNRWRAIILQHADSDEPSEWRSSDGAYIVKFEYQSSDDGQKRWQTRLVHAETEDEIADFTGKAPDEWWPWIVQKASLTAQEDKGIEPIPTSDSAKPQAVRGPQTEKALRITHFEVHLPSDKRANMLAADVDFEISDKLFAQGPSQFQVEILYVNLENHVSCLAGCKNEQLIPEKREYKIQIEFPMPELGDYKPHCIVLSLPSGEHGDYQEDRIFTVVPKR